MLLATAPTAGQSGCRERAPRHRSLSFQGSSRSFCSSSGGNRRRRAWLRTGGNRVPNPPGSPRPPRSPAPPGSRSTRNRARRPRRRRRGRSQAQARWSASAPTRPRLRRIEAVVVTGWVEEEEAAGVAEHVVPVRPKLRAPLASPSTPTTRFCLFWQQSALPFRENSWVVERTFAWLQKCRAILIRYDKKAENYRGLLQQILKCIYRDAVTARIGLLSAVR